ncbi:hypothetical protein [Fusobacterium polymorphum]|uniref:hypothetical protein n=1 Tax=Fusobacterium nucleatum subsp. polymorphum TaxID=76857 RepID=UPI00300B104B
MKKVFLLCLFVILSFTIFSQQLNTDGEAHFDKLVGVKFIKPYYPNGVNYDFLLNYTITKKEMITILQVNGKIQEVLKLKMLKQN